MHRWTQAYFAARLALAVGEVIGPDLGTMLESVEGDGMSVSLTLWFNTRKKRDAAHDALREQEQPILVILAFDVEQQERVRYCLRVQLAEGEK